MNKIIFHIDVNNAFLSWEAVYRIYHLGASLDLRTVPSAVGGSAELRHGIILAKSIPAKEYGIKTGESLYEARQKCPSLLIVPPHYHLYESASHCFMDILKEYSPEVEQYSIDEAFLDLTGTQKLWGDPLELAEVIRKRVSSELGFTINIGISSNKLLAKMASDFTKPDKIHTLFPEEIQTKMWPLPVSDLFFVGRSTFQKLYLLGIRTIGDLANTNPKILVQHLKSFGTILYQYANGIDTSLVSSLIPSNKGYGNSTTIAFDVQDSHTACLVLLSIAETIGMRLRRDNVKIKVLSVSIKTKDFVITSHQLTLPYATDITSEIYYFAVQLFLELWDHCPVRHLGIHTSQVQSDITFRQLDFSSYLSLSLYEKFEKIDRMSDTVRSRYGLDALKRASFLTPLPVDHLSGGITREKMNVDYNKIDLL